MRVKKTKDKQADTAAAAAPATAIVASASNVVRMNKLPREVIIFSFVLSSTNREDVDRFADFCA